MGIVSFRSLNQVLNLQVALREPNKNISQFDSMHKAVIRDYQKAGPVHLISSPDTGCQSTVALQGRYSANKTIQTWVSNRACHPCLLIVLVVLMPAQPKIKQN